jgi:hypothetical protein
MRDRRLAAAALWFLLAFLVWNVRFDYGVRISARSYLNHRALYLRGDEPRLEMASAMRGGIGQSARAATLMALPAACVAVCLVAARLRRVDALPQARDRATRAI